MKRPRTAFRPLDGLLLLDKPAGMSSNQALQRVRHLFRAAKGGHTGSLDPLATGLLPVCFGEATKIAGLLLGARKAYDTVAVLGTTTDTDDADGRPLRERPVLALDPGLIEAALAPLRGAIRQRAPVYSALKQGGEPLYARARRGEAIEAPERDVLVHRLELTGIDGPRLSLHVECGSGTYIRSIVRDLGEALGCGAHVEVLRRLWVAPFTDPRMYRLDELEAMVADGGGGEAALEACLLPIEAGLADFPQLALEPAQARAFGLGQRIDPAAAGGLPVDAPIAVHDPSGTILGLARLDGAGQLHPQRLFTWAATTPGI